MWAARPNALKTARLHREIRYVYFVTIWSELPRNCLSFLLTLLYSIPFFLFGMFCIQSRFNEDRLKSSWTGGSAPLLCRGRRWLLCQVV